MGREDCWSTWGTWGSEIRGFCVDSIALLSTEVSTHSGVAAANGNVVVDRGSVIGNADVVAVDISGFVASEFPSPTSVVACGAYLEEPKPPVVRAALPPPLSSLALPPLPPLCAAGPFGGLLLVLFVLFVLLVASPLPMADGAYLLPRVAD